MFCPGSSRPLQRGDIVTRTRCDSVVPHQTQQTACASQPLFSLLLHHHHHLLWTASGLPVLYDHSLFSRVHDLQHQPTPTPPAPLSQVQTAAQMSPSRTPSAVTATPNLTLIGSVICPPLINPIFPMQAIQKAQSSPMPPESAARRVWSARTARKLILATVSGTIAAMSLSSNRRGMSEWA